MKFSATAAAILAALSVSVSAHAEAAHPANYAYVLPMNLAEEAANEAVLTCAAKGYSVTATVVDMDGVPQVVLRGDHATVHTGESSFRKASPYAPQLATVHNVMALPGAVAFKVNNEMVGALGVGGAPGGDKDEVCAHAGVDKVSGRLPH